MPPPPPPPPPSCFLVTEKKIEAKPRFDKNEREHERVFLAHWSGYVDPYVACTSSDGSTTIPARSDAHPADSAALCYQIEAVPLMEQANDNGTMVYEVRVRYTTRQDWGSLATPPLSRPAEYSGGGQSGTESFLFDVDDVPVVNSAGDRFEDLPVRENAAQSITITRNESSLALDDFALYSHAINSDSVTILGITFDPQTLKLDPPQWQRLTEDGTTYYRVTYTLRIRPLSGRYPDGWRLTLDDVGYNEKTTAGGSTTVRGIVDAHGKELRRPWPLNGSGVKKTNITDAPARFYWKAYLELAFAGFGF